MPRKGKKKKQKTSSSTKTAASEKLQQQTLEELQKKVTESPSKVQPQDQLQQAVASTSQQKVFTSPPLQGIWAIRQQKLLASQSPPEGQLQKASHDISVAGSSKQVQTSKLESTNFQLKLTDKISFTQFILHHNMIPNRVHPEKGGLIGQKNKVMTNMYKIIFHDASIITAIHYDVTIKPMSLVSEKDKSKKIEFELPKALCRNIFEQCRKKHFYDRYPAYDGKKKVFSAKNLPFGNSMMDVFKYRNVYGKSSQYQIILKKMGNIDLSWIKNFKPGLTNIDQTALQILDTIICHATQSRFVNVEEEIFWNMNTNESLSAGVIIGRGAIMSSVLGWKPYLNIEVSYKGFIKEQPVLTCISEIINIDEDKLDRKDVLNYRTKIQNYLQGFKIIYEIPQMNFEPFKQVYDVITLSEQNSFSQFTQTLGDITQIRTIREHLWNSERYDVERPGWPTLHVGSRADGNKLLLPIELCSIMPNQLKKLSKDELIEMEKKTTVNASIYKQKIDETFRGIQVNNSLVMEKEFHISVNKGMEVIPARILPAPELKYAEIKAKVEKGTWSVKPLIKAKNLERNAWTVVNLSGKSNINLEMQKFIKILQTTAKKLGMTIDQPVTPFANYRVDKLNDITQYFRDNKELNLIIVIISNHEDGIYGNVKKISEMEVGVLTQCIKVQTMNKIILSKQLVLVKDLLLKINAKLNGTNHVFDKMPSCLNGQHSCMLVGAKVLHPVSDSTNFPSIAAVAASTDKLAVQYNTALRLQQPNEEIILDLKQIILLQLEIYMQQTKCLPDRIIYYRDEVNKEQLLQVMSYELNAIKKAVFDFTRGGDIEITCLIVKKKHNVRIFPTNSEDVIDNKTNNVKVGTVIDTHITHPNHIDFYLVSHTSNQGTVRPTNYKCIYNQSNFTEDELEELTYYLCYIYSRCVKSVKCPAPTYYAHLAAYRGKTLIRANKDFELSNLEQEQKDFIIKMEKSPMYFI